MKKTFLILAVLSLLIMIAVPSFDIAYAAGTNEYSAKALYVIDSQSGNVIMARDEEKRYPIASMVKIMTLLMTYDAIDAGKLTLDEKVTISEYASGMGGSQMFLDKGEQYCISDLIKGVTVASANDAATALGEKISGDIGSFVNEMNLYAKNLGMENTLFCNATGLPNSGEQYSCAKDVTIMMNKLLQKPNYYNYSKIWMEEYCHPNGRKTILTNTNKLVRFYDKCDAGKTGFTNDAMYCISASAQSNKMRIIATVLGEPDSKTRFRDVTNIFNYCFANFENKVVVQKGDPILSKLEVKRAKDVPIELYADKDIAYFCKKGIKSKANIEIKLADNLIAPIQKDAIVGSIVIRDDSQNVICEGNVRTVNAIEKQTYFDALNKVLKNWLV